MISSKWQSRLEGPSGLLLLLSSVFLCFYYSLKGKNDLEEICKAWLKHTVVKRIYDPLKCSAPEIESYLPIPVTCAVQQKAEGKECEPQKEEALKNEIPVREIFKADFKPAASLLSQQLPSVEAQFQALPIPVTRAVQEKDPIPIICVSTNQVQNNKRLAETPINEVLPKRKKNLSTSSPKVSPVHTPSTGCTVKIKRRPVLNRLNAGHFSAWGVEDDQILYYIQKETSDARSVGTAFVPTSCQKAPKLSQSCQNSKNNNRVNQKNRYTISPFRVIQVKKKKKKKKLFAVRMKTNSKVNPKTLFYSHFSERLVSMPRISSTRGSINCDEKNPPNSSKIWICDTCSLSNKAPAVRCRGCEILKYGVGLQRQWIPAADASIDTSCKGIQSNEKSTNMCGVDNSAETMPQLTNVAEMPTSLANSLTSHATDAICSVPQMDSSACTSSIRTEDRTAVELLPTGNECATNLSPAKINSAVYRLSPVSAGTGPDEQLAGATSTPAKPTQQGVPSGKAKRKRSVREDRDSLVPGEPAANKTFRIQDSSASISFPYVFGPPPMDTTSSTAVPVPPTFTVPAPTRFGMAAAAVSRAPFQMPSFLFGCSTETSNSNICSGMSGSSGNFPSAFGQGSSALTSTPFNTGVANAGITGNPSSLPPTGPGFPFSGHLVPNFNFGCSANNTVFRFGASNNNQFVSHGPFNTPPAFTTGTPRLMNSGQPNGFSHRKMKVAVRKRKCNYQCNQPR